MPSGCARPRGSRRGRMLRSRLPLGGSPFTAVCQCALAAARAEEAEAPTAERLEAALEAGEEGEVNHEPHHPAREAGDADAVEAHDCTAPRNGGHAPGV